MFERYTEKARRVIFFSRYEASQFGSPYIETEHLLLGVLREDPAPTRRLILSPDEIRRRIEAAIIVREKTSTSVDLPLSNESKRVLAYAAEEAEQLGHKHIGSEHLMLGLLREGRTLAATLLAEQRVTLDETRKTIKSMMLPGEIASPATRTAPKVVFVEGGQPLVMSALMFVLPRTGEEIVLNGPQGEMVYVAEKVRFVMERDPQLGPDEAQALQRIEVHVRKI